MLFRSGFLNEAWDNEFLDLLEKAPEQLVNMRIAEYAAKGGMEGAEVIMWLIMRGALSANVQKVHQSYYLPSMTGIATAIYEPQQQATPAAVLQRHRVLNLMTHVDPAHRPDLDHAPTPPSPR